MKVKGTLFLLAFGSAAASAAPMFTMSSYTNNTNGPFFIGIEFNVTQNTQVAQLGVIDGNNNGILATDTTVGLYSTTPGSSSKSATYLTSGTVAAGTVGTSIGVRQAFWVGVTPIILAPGNYFIGATSASEGYGSSVTYSFLTGVSYVNGWFTGSNTTFQGVGVNINLTNQAGGASRWPTALFDTTPAASPIPEPASLSLIGLGLGAIAVLRGKLA